MSRHAQEHQDPIRLRRPQVVDEDRTPLGACAVNRVDPDAPDLLPDKRGTEDDGASAALGVLGDCE